MHTTVLYISICVFEIERENNVTYHLGTFMQLLFFFLKKKKKEKSEKRSLL